MLGAARLSDQTANNKNNDAAFFKSPKTAVIVAAIAVLLLVALNVELHPILVRANAAQVGAIGLALTTWGLALAIVGFGITWWQIQRSRNAAQAVASAVSTMRKDYASFDVITELRSARAHAESVIAALSQSDWSAANKSYWGIRVSLIKMSSSGDVITENDASKCKDYVMDVLSATELIQQNADTSPELIPSPQLVVQMTEADNFLISLEQQLKGTFRADR